MPFKHKHIHSRLSKNDNADTSHIDEATRLPVASSSSSSSIIIISAGSQINDHNDVACNDKEDDDLSSLSSEDSNNDDQNTVDANTIFKTREAFEAYARVRFAATTQPTSRGAEKKNT
jgi:hypothetical protein